jgi:adenosylmethionine-8-amino-7-oxononanoate aminotransferase
MAFGTSIGGIDANRVGFGPLVPSTSTVPHDSADALADEIDKIGADRVAAFFIEPVIGAGGVYPPAPAMSRPSRRSAARRTCCCRRDAVIVGFGASAPGSAASASASAPT